MLMWNKLSVTLHIWRLQVYFLFLISYFLFISSSHPLKKWNGAFSFFLFASVNKPNLDHKSVHALIAVLLVETLSLFSSLSSLASFPFLTTELAHFQRMVFSIPHPPHPPPPTHSCCHLHETKMHTYIHTLTHIYMYFICFSG